MRSKHGAPLCRSAPPARRLCAHAVCRGWRHALRPLSLHSLALTSNNLQANPALARKVAWALQETPAVARVELSGGDLDLLRWFLQQWTQENAAARVRLLACAGGPSVLL